MKSWVVALLLFSANAFAIGFEVPQQRTLETVSSEHKAKVLRGARAAFTLRDGSQWITHSVPAKHEPSAIGVTRFDRDGSATVFLVSDWPPEGRIPGGYAGSCRSQPCITAPRFSKPHTWNRGSRTSRARTFAAAPIPRMI